MSTRERIEYLRIFGIVPLGYIRQPSAEYQERRARWDRRWR